MILLLALACSSAPDHGHGHGDHATVDHRFDDAEKWAEVFDDPERDAWQKPQAVVGAMSIEPGMVVADIGAGTGYFNPHLAKAVGPEGSVIAIDIEQTLVDHMNARSDKTDNVQARLGKSDDPGLKPAEVDRILLVDTYHHINERTAYFGALRQTVKPGGHLIVVDFKPGDLPVGPPPGHKIPPEKVVAELKNAGWNLVAQPDVLPHQYVLDFTL